MIRETSAGDGSELRWFKSSYSDSSNSNECVEVATMPGAVHVRDSKCVEGPQLALTHHAWAEFVAHASGS
ncbi:MULTISPECIES: DUF397 domain-containing protein [unclassified Streptomyces]|uniref:DUF397 domain-containing protein n=1 Tax=unclassified Streptomyces TaxID=2593676 RepID=UPI000F71BDAB|nr:MULTISPECIES: DUF397 domain-containing protein [unclassified Streptomyces]AZM61153.1 DUF397 domain-containing protein [Streptomyces sp. WAC 01438]RSM95393.1 DUF397 domain-containing protein [Streptomyces sp. WAC 01420]